MMIREHSVRYLLAMMLRRVDCAYLAELVSSGRLRENEAHELAYDLTYGLVKNAYKL